MPRVDTKFLRVKYGQLSLPPPFFFRFLYAKSRTISVAGRLIRPMDYAFPVWRSAARPHIRKLQMLQSKRLRIATSAPWYIGNWRIHDDFTDHIRSLIERSDSKLADVANPLVTQLGRYLR